MFYLIYLYSCLILMCSNLVKSEQHDKHFVWLCASQNCDKAISEFETKSKLLYRDHSQKLTYELKERGKVLKKPLDESEFWFAEIGGKQGYISKNNIREVKVLQKDSLINVEGDNPLINLVETDRKENISPSQPIVVDGTTIYGLNESDVNKSVAESDSIGTAPLVSDNVPSFSGNVSQSALADDVDKKLEQLGHDYVNSTVPSSSEGVGQSGSESDATNKSEVEDINNSTTVSVDEEDVEVEIGEDEEDGRKDVTKEMSSDRVSNDSTDVGNDSAGVRNDGTGVSNDSSGASTGSTGVSNDSNGVSNNSTGVGNDSNGVSNNSTGVGNDSSGASKDSIDISNESTSVSNDSTSVSNDSTNVGNDSSSVSSGYKESPPTINEKSTSRLSNLEDSINDSVIANQSDAQIPPADQSKGNVDYTDTLPEKEPGMQQPVATSRYTIGNRSPYHGPHLNDNAQLSDAESGNNLTDNAHELKDSISANENIPSKVTYPSPPGEKTFYTQFGSPYATFSPPTKPDEVSASSPTDDLKNQSAGDQDTTTSSPQTFTEATPPQTFTEATPPQTIENQFPPLQPPIDSSPPTSSSEPHKNTEPSNINNQEINVEPVQKVHDKVEPTPPDVSGKEPYEEVNISSNERNVAQDITENKPNTIEETSSNYPNENNIPEGPTTKEPNVEEISTFEEPKEAENYPNSAEDIDYKEPNISDEETSEETNTAQEIMDEEETTKREDLEEKLKSLQDNELVDKAGVIEESPGFYSSVTSLFASLSQLFDKSPLPSQDSTQSHQHTSSPSTAPAGFCYEGETCRGLEPPIGGEDRLSYCNQHYANVDKWKNSTPLSFNSIIYIGISSLVILLFSLGYYYIDKSQSSWALVAKVNELSQELFVTKKERDTLEEQLLKIKENCNMMDSSKMKQDSKLSSLQCALEQSESARAELEESLVIMEKENEMLMEKGMEMHKLLSETISEEERSQILLANIDELKQSLSDKLDEIVTLTNQLDKKNEEMQLMQIDVGNANDRVRDLEKKLETSKTETENLFSKKLQDQQQQIIKLQKLVEEKGMSVAKLESELAKTKVERDSADARASSAEAGLQSAHSVGAGQAREAWLDSTAVRAALALAEKQNETLQQNMSDITTNNKTLQDKLERLNEELKKLNSKYEDVEKEKVNALTKLQVLSDYFKEKESKLQEELGVKESQWLQKETEDHTIYEQMKSLREEIASYKAQNDKLKAEILEQEASYKVQIANEEQKSYDNWVALRQAERKVKELQMESAHFRNRLTQIETTNSHTASEPLNPNGLDKVSGSFSAPSPPFMMMPPLPQSDFFPLPPPPLHPSASRPPPLGRISSPQLTGEMIPPPPLVSFDMYPPPPSSTPPPPFPLYKPQPRDRPPPPKDSPPSNYSSESVNDKPPRRRRR